MSSLASSQSQLLRGVSGANALGANTPAQGRRVSTLVRAGKAPEEHVPSKAKSDDAPELDAGTGVWAARGTGGKVTATAVLCHPYCEPPGTATPSRSAWARAAFQRW